MLTSKTGGLTMGSKTASMAMTEVESDQSMKEITECVRVIRSGNKHKSKEEIYSLLDTGVEAFQSMDDSFQHIIFFTTVHLGNPSEYLQQKLSLEERQSGFDRFFKGKDPKTAEFYHRVLFSNNG
jgi:hypothetical protein